MSHIVIHDVDGVDQYQRFDELSAAIAHVEALRNREGVVDARLFELTEVEFEMKPYFKVELGDSVAAAESAGAPEILPTAADTEVVFETASEPIEAMATVAATEATDPVDPDDEADPADPDGEPRLTSTGGEARRGLFGR